jgi:hypothetical protein
MFTVHLTRLISGADGTFGNFVLPIGSQLLKLWSGELPWRNNVRGNSCIPIGTYKCVWTFSKHLGWGYSLLNVPGRAGIRIHVANFCGLASEGYKQELAGCIALGLAVGTMGHGRMLLNSRLAIAKFHNALARKPFLLEIENGATIP